MVKIMLMQNVLRCPEDTFYIYILITPMDSDVWFYNRIPCIRSDLFAIEMCTRLIFEAASETLSNCHVFVCKEHVL